MASQITGFLNQLSSAHHLNAAQSVKSQAASAGSGSEADSGSVTANDFLTLLVTEMKNQDPTANTDPNEYINQLVQVNSLQQLISINQTLTADSTVSIRPGVKTDGVQAATDSLAIPRLANGNLTVPAKNPAAHRVAESLISSSK